MESTVSEADLLRIVYGDHDDPFSVLGYHEVELEGHIRFAVRVYIPDAVRVQILRPGQSSLETENHHRGGFFEALLDKPLEQVPYQIVVTYEDGVQVQRYDAYSFGTIKSQYEVHLIGEGTDEFVWTKFGARPITVGEIPGIYFSVWAPNARRVSVTGDFSRWNGRHYSMRKLKPSGIWEIFIPELAVGSSYKYEVVFPSRHVLMKADPYAFASEVRPRCASIVTDLSSYAWNDQKWLEERKLTNHFERPLSLYEVHFGSWRHKPELDDETGHRFFNYREIAHQLVDYVLEMGYTHLEIMPVLEHLLDASWGYQVTGYYAPSSRYGSPDDFKYFVDHCHRNGIGVIMDWVPAHFPRDYTALARFDGTALYEHLDPRKGFHPHWGTYIFNYGRNEVRNFLIGSALFWLQEYHLDGLRVDAVASMLYLDYGRAQGQWLPNKFGGRENLEAIEFIKELNERVHKHFPDVLMIAEESTSWPLVTRPTYLGGLGFDLKWNMGWMHDFLKYMAADPIFRKFQHNTLTWSLFYAFSENFILPLSHDEVVHLKKSMLDKMPGEYWQKMANLRLCYGFQYGHPGKKLLFMGSEFGQWREWNEKQSLDWELLEQPLHRQLRTYVSDLNSLYKAEPALWESDFESVGFQWIDFADAEQSVVAFIRRGKQPAPELIWILNFTPVHRTQYRIGVPLSGFYREQFNSDNIQYGGSGLGNEGLIATQELTWHGFQQSIEILVPPLAVLVLKHSAHAPNSTQE